MAKLIENPTIIESVGNLPKRIEEFVGRVNSASDTISIARMQSPGGWIEPGQKPDFSEFTLVLNGTLKVETSTDHFHVKAGQAIIVDAGEWVRYSCPEPPGAEYIAICLPAFSPETVHRDS
jgi:ethanolamine utilization protein EutQ